MRFLAVVGLACLCVFGPTPKTCADRGGVLVYKFGLDVREEAGQNPNL